MTTCPTCGKHVGRDRLELSAESKAAKALGMDIETFRVLVVDRYGMTWCQERDARLPERDLTTRERQALRGHITREMLREMSRVVAS